MTLYPNPPPGVRLKSVFWSVFGYRTRLESVEVRSRSQLAPAGNLLPAWSRLPRVGRRLRFLRRPEIKAPRLSPTTRPSRGLLRPRERPRCWRTSLRATSPATPTEPQPTRDTSRKTQSEHSRITTSNATHESESQTSPRNPFLIRQPHAPATRCCRRVDSNRPPRRTAIGLSSEAMDARSSRSESRVVILGIPGSTRADPPQRH